MVRALESKNPALDLVMEASKNINKSFVDFNECCSHSGQYITNNPS